MKENSVLYSNPLRRKSTVCSGRPERSFVPKSKHVRIKENPVIRPVVELRGNLYFKYLIISADQKNIGQKSGRFFPSHKRRLSLQ